MSTSLPTPSDLQLLEELIAAAPVKVRERLASEYCSPAALRNRRLAERDLAYRELAVGSAETSGSAVALRIRSFVESYRVGAWRFDCGRAPPPIHAGPLSNASTDGNR